MYSVYRANCRTVHRGSFQSNERKTVKIFRKSFVGFLKILSKIQGQELREISQRVDFGTRAWMDQTKSDIYYTGPDKILQNN